MGDTADGQHDHDDHEHVHGEQPHEHEGPSCEHGDHCCGNCNHDHHDHDHEHGHGHPHEHPEGEHHHGKEDHNHEHGHEHHDHEHHEHDHASPEKEKFSLRTAFHNVVDYIKNNKAETASLGLASTILLASTALTVPLLPATLGAIALGAASIYLLKKTSDTALDNAMAFGKKLAMSPMKLGLAVGALTTIPELMVSLNALVHGQNEIAIGNVLGGNIAHTLLILGATAAIAGIGAGKKGLSWAFNTKVMAWATGLFAGEMALGSVLPPAADQIMYPLVGLGMLGMAGYYLKQRLLARDQDNAAAAADGKECATGACPFHDHGHGDEHDHHQDHELHDHDHDHDHEHGDDPLDDGHNHGNSHDGKAGPNPDSMPSWFNAAWCAAGMAGLAGASKLLVDSASQFGANAGLSNDFIGAVAVGLGVALPELILSVKAAMKKQGEFALGNVIGCNIFTTLLVGGAVSVAGVVAPDAMKIATPEAVLNTAAFAGSAGLATAALLSNKGGIKKWHGWAGMAMYAAYAATAWVLGHQAPTVQPPQTTPAPIIQQQQLPAPLKAPATPKVVLNDMPKFVEESSLPESIKTSKNSPAAAGAATNFMPPAEHLKPAPFALF